jgi:hypothetical protein
MSPFNTNAADSGGGIFVSQPRIRRLTAPRDGGGGGRLWPRPKLVVPVLKTHRLFETKGQIGTKDSIECLSNDLCQLPAGRVSVHRCNDVRTLRQEFHLRPHQIRLHRIRLATNRGIARVAVREKHRERNRIYGRLSDDEPPVSRAGLRQPQALCPAAWKKAPRVQLNSDFTQRKKDVRDGA